jgi:hypothetical protein
MKRLFRTPTPKELAARELAEAERAILEALTAREWADAIVQYQTARIKRLREMLSAAGDKHG